MSRSIAKLVLALAAAGLVSLAAPAAAQKPDKPANIVVILADDMGWADNSIFKDMGGRFSTPNLERLAKSGVRFPNAYVTAPVCSPSRAGLMTGRYQNRFGFEYLDDPPMDDAMDIGLDPKELTLANVLNGAGYHTGIVGKWHLGIRPEYRPLGRGFDEFFGILRGGTSYINTSLPGVIVGEGFSKSPGGGVWRDGAPLLAWDPHPNIQHNKSSVTHDENDSLGASVRNPAVPVVEGPNYSVVNDYNMYLTDDFSDHAVSFIERNKAKPFFLYLAYNAPHSPLQVTQKYYDRFPDIKDQRTRVYAGMISAVDDGVGRVLDTLEKEGLRDNTLVVFLSDNGCNLFTGVCTCEPLRGGKATQFEGGVRTPMVMSWPDKVQMGETYKEEVSSLDIFPTAVKAAGAKMPSDRVYDGVDLVPYLMGKRQGAPHQALFWWREPYRSIRIGDWKLWESRTGPEHYLFNLADDPGELNNLYAKFPDKVAELDKMMMDWHADKKPAAWPSGWNMHATFCNAEMHMPG